MKKILVTGATGFLGKYIIEELKDNGYYVLALGRNVKIGEQLKCNQVEFIKGDLLDNNQLDKVIQSVDMVIHAGALSTVWGRWENFYNCNVIGTQNIVDSCLKNNIKKLVYVSSPSIYTSNIDRLNISENDFDENNELNFYIKSKILSEKIINNASNKGLNTTIIRPRGLFGIGDTSIIPRIIKINKKIGIPLINHGDNLVDITCVENVALALRLCLENTNSNGKVYNITNDEPIKFKEILEKLFNEINMRPRYINLKFNTLYNIATKLEKIYKILNIYQEPPFTKYTVATLGFSQTLNIENAKKDLDYKPKITINEGIKKYARDYKQKNK